MILINGKIELNKRNTAEKRLNVQKLIGVVFFPEKSITHSFYNTYHIFGSFLSTRHAYYYAFFAHEPEQ